MPSPVDDYYKQYDSVVAKRDFTEGRRAAISAGERGDIIHRETYPTPHEPFRRERYRYTLRFEHVDEDLIVDERDMREQFHLQTTVRFEMPELGEYSMLDPRPDSLVFQSNTHNRRTGTFTYSVGLADGTVLYISSKTPLTVEQGRLDD